MRDYVHLHRKAIASWVFQDPRRWHLFSYLLMRADEEGRVEVSVNNYCTTFQIPRTTVLRLLDEMAARNILGLKTDNKRTTITICKYASYNRESGQMWTTNGQQREEKERNSPHTPFYKEREESPPTTTSSEIEKLDEEMEWLAANQLQMETLAMREHIAVEEVKASISDFRLECIAQMKFRHENHRDLVAHFGNWLRIALEHKNKKQHAANQQLSREERRVAERQQRLQSYAAVAAEFYNQASSGNVRQPGTVPPDVPF